MVATIAEKDHISIEFAIEIRKVIIIQDGVRTDPESALPPEAPADSGIFYNSVVENNEVLVDRGADTADSS